MSYSETEAGVLMTCCNTRYATVKDSMDHTCDTVTYAEGFFTRSNGTEVRFEGRITRRYLASAGFIVLVEFLCLDGLIRTAQSTNVFNERNVVAEKNAPAKRVRRTPTKGQLTSTERAAIMRPAKLTTKDVEKVRPGVMKPGDIILVAITGEYIECETRVTKGEQATVTKVIAVGGRKYEIMTDLGTLLNVGSLQTFRKVKPQA